MEPFYIVFIATAVIGFVCGILYLANIYFGKASGVLDPKEEEEGEGDG